MLWSLDTGLSFDSATSSSNPHNPTLKSPPLTLSLSALLLMLNLSPSKQSSFLLFIHISVAIFLKSGGFLSLPNPTSAKSLSLESSPSLIAPTCFALADFYHSPRFIQPSNKHHIGASSYYSPHTHRCSNPLYQSERRRIPTLICSKSPFLISSSFSRHRSI
jgi:hypothetical protein